jgi:peptide/nickel transport system substrate-binding protein
MFINKLRNWFWNYPEIFFFGDRSMVAELVRTYKAGVPFTTSFLLIGVIVGFFYITLSNGKAFLVTGHKTLIEGVVVGTDVNTGKLNQISKINPLTSDSNKTRLEKDLIELMYESLIRVDQNGVPEGVLAGYLEIEKGRKYQFKLKDNLYWHDGKAITADDVVATFKLLQQLDANPNTSTMYSKAAVQMDIEKQQSDPKSFVFVAKGSNLIPGFFEAISFKIMPAHLLKDVTPENINSPDPIINRNPVGSGPYKFFAKSEDSLDLVVFDEYHNNKPSIPKIKFKFFPTEDSAIEALRTGQIHTLVGVSVAGLDELQKNSNIAVTKSNVLYNQYWGIYFNLGDNSNPALKDVKVRTAISYAIDKENIVNNVMKGYAAIANGPIPPNSFAYSSQYNHAFNPELAVKTLDESGWKVVDDSGIRMKNGVKLEFKLFVLENADRDAVANSIKSDLAKIGVEVNISQQLPSDIRDVLVSRSFDAVLYGTQTFIDPDRYELFHSSQIKDPGLNISSWASSEMTGSLDPLTNKKIQIPESDDVLDIGRRIIDDTERKKKYKELQKLIMADSPVIFLYYPEEVYIYNKRVTKIVLSNLNSIEQRFVDIDKWSLLE